MAIEALGDVGMIHRQGPLPDRQGPLQELLGLRVATVRHDDAPERVQALRRIAVLGPQSRLPYRQRPCRVAFGVSFATCTQKQVREHIEPRRRFRMLLAVLGHGSIENLLRHGGGLGIAPGPLYFLHA